MHVGDVDPCPPPPEPGPSQEEYRGASFGARCCLVAIVVIIFAVVVLPLLIWMLGIAAGR